MAIESIDDVLRAVRRARNDISLADSAVGGCAQLCAGRLRKSTVSHSVLVELKKELANYNMHTGKWSDK